MGQEPEFCFGRFRLDPPNARLLNGRQAVAMQPKAFDVLAHLVRNPGRLVTQEELLAEVWAGTIVGDSSLKTCIRQIRKALGDRVRQPQFIETVHRRGYRFIAPVTAEGAGAPAVPPPRLADAPKVGGPILVGRDAELDQLRVAFDKARGGQRQVVFVIGGPGCGKTALVEAFVGRSTGPGYLVAAGQCFEQFGSGEAYQPVLEAFGRLSRESHFAPHLPTLTQRAPSWAAQLPGTRTAGGTSAPSERMLREMAEALEEMTARTPLVIVLEDLHWGDYSTLDLVSALARRREPARLMLIATYRPAEAVLSEHPLRTVKRDLQTRGLCHEIPLSLLTESDVAEYLEARFPGSELADRLARPLHQRTEGHPLFLVDLLDDWVAQGVMERRGSGWILSGDPGAGVPASVKALVNKQLERLEREDLRVLEGACVAGVEFSAAAAAAAIDADLVSVEERCEDLARRHHYLQRKGQAEWPDGTVSARYRFAHELYHREVAERLTGARGRLLHQRLGERLEVSHSANAAAIAPELALHFEQGRDPARAARYLELAANRAAQNYAHREAIDYLRRALAVIERLPAAERTAHELRLQVELGLQLQATQGFGSPAAKTAYTRARDLCHECGDSTRLFEILWGRWLCHKVRSELPAARTMAGELFDLATRLGNPDLVLQSHQALAVTALCLGEPTEAVENMRRGVALHDPTRHGGLTFLFGQDPGVACRAFGGVALWILGYPDQGLAACGAAARLSHELLQPSSQALALHFVAMVHQLRREPRHSLVCAELALAIAAEQGLSFWRAGATVMRGWAIAEGGDSDQGIALLRQGIDDWDATCSVTYRPYYLGLLAEVLGKNGRLGEALERVAEALRLVEETSERLYEAELHRLRGELLIASTDKAKHDEAEKCFQRALDVARGQQAKAFELRAAMSLARHQGPPRQTLLAETVGWFREGLDTPDLRDAKSCLVR